MLSDQRILITGVTGNVAFPVAKALAVHNEVLGLARFSDPTARARVEAAGIRPIVADLGSGDLSMVPTDVSYLLHLGYFRGGASDFDTAIRVNGEGTGALMAHCRTAKAALVMSSNVIYAPRDDPWHASVETDPIGGMIPYWSPTSPTAKVAQEAIARYCARSLGLRTVITRLNSVYGPDGTFLPTSNMDAVVDGKPVTARWDPHPHAPIHVDDIVGQLEAMLDAASSPALVVNWAGDDQVTIQQWAAYAASYCRREAVVDVRATPGTTRSNLADITLRRSITGPCSVSFEPAFRQIYEHRHGPVEAEIVT
jgi:nucleoside-diphosphate-sugar epimerase